LPGSSWHNGRLQINGSGKWELRAANGIFEFMQGSSNNPIARLTADGSLSLGGELSAGNVPIVMPSGPLDLYVNSTTGDDLNDGLSPATAKQTIQAALHRIPMILDGPVTVHVADGTYNESLAIGNRVSRYIDWIVLQGNESSPQNVVLDGEGTRDNGMTFFFGFVEVRGMEITNFVEVGIEVDWGLLIVGNCRVVGNSKGIEVYTSAISIQNSVIANSGSNGIHVSGGSEADIGGSSVTGNGGHGIRVVSGSDLEVDGSLVVQNNGGIGVWSDDRSGVDFENRADLTINSNTGDEMRASYSSIIRGYGNGTTGTCVEGDAHSMCEP